MLIAQACRVAVARVVRSGDAMRHWVLVGLVFLAGCGAPLDREAELAALRDARPPFATFRTLPYEKVAVPSDTEFQIMRGSAVMDLDPHGKTFAKGFELPAGTAGLNIDVASYEVRGGRAFHPIVTLLDVDKEPLRVTQPSAVHVVTNPRAGGKWRLLILVQIQPEDRVRARYLVVHTSREIVEVGFALPDEPWQEARSAPIFIFIPAGGGSSGPGPAPRIGSSPAGPLSLTISEMKR